MEETKRKVLLLSHGPIELEFEGRIEVRDKFRNLPSPRPSSFQGEGVWGWVYLFWLKYSIEIFLFAAGVFLRFLFLNSRSLWFDEAKTLVVCRAPFGRIVPLVRTLEGIPPLYFVALHFWLGLFSNPVPAMRLFSALCGIASMAVFFFFSREIFCIPSPIQGEGMLTRSRLAFFIACFSSYWIHAAQDGRAYSLLLLVSVAESYVMVCLARKWSLRLLAAYAVVGVFGMYTHTYFNFLLLAHFAYGWFGASFKGKKLIHWFALHALLAASYLPWASSLLMQMRLPHTSILAGPLTLGQLSGIFGTLLFDESFLNLFLGEWIRVIGYLLLAFLCGGFFIWKRSNDKAESRPMVVMCGIHLLIPLAAVRATEIILHRPITEARYFVILSPWLYVAIAWAVGSGNALWSRLSRIGIEALVVAGMIGYNTVGRYVDPHLPRLAEVVRRVSSPGDTIVHLDPFYYLPLRYFYMTDRTQYLLCADPKMVTWSALPGYPAIMDRGRLSQRYIVIDPRRRLFHYGYGIASGEQLSGYVCP